MRNNGPFSDFGLPQLRTGQTIGLLGGSFDPPHAGHTHLTRQALQRFGLDRIWWLVSPGNPLKTERPAPLSRRMEAVQKVMDHPRVDVSDLEARLGTKYTAEALSALSDRFPGLRFIWLMGADNLASFHHWQRWREIFHSVPIGVIARPTDMAAARHSKAARIFSGARLGNRQSRLLPKASPPAWCLVNVPMLDLSSQAIRASGDWQR